MKKFSQYGDIHAVLTKAQNDLLMIEQEYNQSLYKQVVSEGLLVEIKDFLGNLRSSLDYLRKKISKHNFPICETEARFDNCTTDLAEKIKQAILKWQPFIKGNEWLGWFNELNNKSKHFTLIPQKRVESVETRVSHPAGGSISWNSGVTFGNGVRVMGVPIDPQTQLPMPNNIVKTEKITWVSFHFDNEGMTNLPGNISALPFLKKCFENVVKMVAEIEKEIQLEKEDL